MTVLLNIKFGKLANCLRAKMMASVLSGLKFISHSFAQLVSTWRSELIMPSISNMLVAEENKELSSANNLVRLNRDSEMSLT